MRLLKFALPLLSTALCFTANASPVESVDAHNFVDNVATICGSVAQVVKQPKRTILNLGAAYPSEHIAIVIWAPELPQFEKQFGNLYAAKGKRACANGRVVVYKHHLQVAPKTTNKLTIR